jgi:hypothetical protein
MQTERDLEHIAVLLDSKFKGPFGIRFGWDGIIGLIPIIGDFATTIVSTYIVLRSAAIGVAPPVLIRMLLNIAIDNGIAAIPFIGWLGDFAWKSNLRNIDLVRAHRRDPTSVSRRSSALLLLIVGAVLFFSLALAILAGIATWNLIVWVGGLF